MHVYLTVMTMVPNVIRGMYAGHYSLLGDSPRMVQAAPIVRFRAVSNSVDLAKKKFDILDCGTVVQDGSVSFFRVSVRTERYPPVHG
jgi:hypothetical protein